MKNLHKIILAATLFCFSSCDELIETEPRFAVVPEVALADIGGYRSLVASSYNDLHDFQYYGQQMMLAPDALADNIVIANNTGRYTGQVINAVGSHINIWNSVISDVSVDGNALNSGVWEIINKSNIVIEGVDGVPQPDGSLDEAENTVLKGEAYFLRALAYHDLMRVYGYAPGNEVSGFNLGVPLRLEAITTLGQAEVELPRATNIEVYNQIEADLQQAINFLPAAAETSEAPYRATKAAAHALLARVYLYWSRWNDAAMQAQAALDATDAVLVSAENYEESFTSSPNPESILEMEIISADWSGVDGVNNSLSSLTSREDPAGQFAVKASNELIAAFEEDDVRADLWVDREENNNFDSKKWAGEKGDFLENIPLIRYSEVLLILAEAQARSGNASAALNNINNLRANRGLEAANVSGNALTDLILDERRKELVLEGHRFFDLKRLGLNIPKPSSAAEPLVAANDFRLLAPLPNSQLLLNDLLEQNPGYEVDQ